MPTNLEEKRQCAWSFVLFFLELDAFLLNSLFVIKRDGLLNLVNRLRKYDTKLCCIT